MNRLACSSLALIIGTAAAVMTTAPEAHATTSIRSKALSTAAAQKGDPYKWGAAGPNAFDCSGLTQYSFKKAGKDIPRTAQAQRNKAKRISSSNRTKGDLVFFHGSNGVYHVAIYAGSGYIWEAPKPGKRVQKVKIWSKSISYGRF